MADIRLLDPQLLLVFEALVDTQSTTLSAARLNLSQSAVSGALKRLRNIFDDQLFERRSHGLTPTPRALELSIEVSEILLALRSLAAPHSFDPKHATGTVVFLATDFAIATKLAGFRAELARSAPRLNVMFRPFSGFDVASAKHLNDVDFVIGSRSMLPESYTTTFLSSEPLKLFMAPDHPLSSGSFTMKSLTLYPHVLVSLSGRNSNTHLDGLLNQNDLERRVATLCHSFLTLPVLLQGSHSLAVAPKSLLDVTQSNIVARDLPVELPDVQLFAAWHRRRRGDPLHSWLRGILSQTG